MKTILSLLLVTVVFAGQAWGLELLVDGPGYLDMDPDNLHPAETFDFDRDGLPDLIRMSSNILTVYGLDGSTFWTTTIDTLAICPSCTAPNGWWSFYFEGFFASEPGQYDAIVGYYYDDWDQDLFIRGSLAISTTTGAVRYHFVDRDLNVAVDLDGDSLVELVMSVDNGVNQPSSWEVWGYTGVSSVPPGVPANLKVGRNLPNPFNPETTVNFELDAPRSTRIEIHDAAGRLVLDRPLGVLQAGTHRFNWRGVDRRGARVSSGTYILTVVAGNERQTRKMMLLK